MDISEFEPFLKIGFSTPSVEQDSEPTFGTMVSSINICLKFLTKVSSVYSIKLTLKLYILCFVYSLSIVQLSNVIATYF